MHTEIERRFTAGAVELRAARFTGKTHQIGGYAAVFNKRSENLGGAKFPFFEIIEPGFFDSALTGDAVCLFNHDSNLILGRQSSGTLRISQDRTGLLYECDVDEGQTYGRDLLISLERRDVFQSSFAFTVRPDKRRFVEEGNTVICYLMKGGCERLWDCSPVTTPAYPDATVALKAAERALGRSFLPQSPAAAAASRERALQLAAAEMGSDAAHPCPAAARRARELQLADLA